MARKRSKKNKEHYKPNRSYVKKVREKLSDSEWWTPDKKKKNHIRVLPPWDDRGICVVRRVLHFGFEEGGRNRAFPCLEDNEPWLPKEPCPVCHVVKKMGKGDKDEREAANDLKKASPRYLVQIIDCNDIERGVQLWAGPSSFGKYFISLLEDEDIEDVTDPERGYDIYFEVSGKGRGTRYDYRLRAKPTPISYDNWEDELQDLIETIEVRNTDELIELLEENYGNAFDIDKYLDDFEESEEEEEEEDEKEKKRKRGKKKSGKHRKEERDEEEENDNDDDDDDGDDEEEYSYDEIMKMKRKQLLNLIRKEELPIEADDWNSLRELRELVVDELGLEDEEED